MNLSIEHLKVDQTAISLETHQIFVNNINIPERYLDQIRPILHRAYRFIESEYRNIGDVRYQLTATYYLKHSDTGHLRHWAGSFLPKAENISSVDSFHHFGPNFINRLEVLCDRDSISGKLLFHNVDTKWMFDSLTSVVITVQASVPDNYPRLGFRGLRQARYGRHYRVHNTIPLP